MVATHLIAARVPEKTKLQFRALAEREQMTESVLMKRLIASALNGIERSDEEILTPPGRQLRGSRLSVRLHPQDRQRITDRAAARQMAAATYVSVLVRAHLCSLSPLPKAELLALKRSTAELGAIGRNLNQLARIAQETNRLSGLTREDLWALLKVCEVLRDHTKDLIKANARSWESGYDIDAS